MAQIDDRSLDVNEHGVLRIPAELWLSILFLCRHWVLALVVTVSARKSQDSALLLGSDFSWVVLAIELPALFFLALCAQRRPQAGQFVRSLWQYAPWFAHMTIALHLVHVFWYLEQSSYWLPWPELFLVSCSLIDVAIAYALIQPGHLRRVLAEFPAPLSERQPR